MSKAEKVVEMRVEHGSPLPLGTLPHDGGINFSLFSRHAEKVELLLYDTPDASKHRLRIPLDPDVHRTGDIWHVWVGGLRAGQAYAYHLDGPCRPELGMRYNSHRLLLDPYATALAGTDHWDFAKALGFDLASPCGDLSFWHKDNEQWMARCLVTSTTFDWQGDRPLRHPWQDTIIYETHVRGLTIHPSSGATRPGTFLGVVEKIPYLQELGITSLELMPVQEFNEQELTRCNPLTDEPLRNYWGYSSVAFFAPKQGYSSRTRPGCQVHEFKTMVRELHRAGIEVILDMVFNHTAEGDERGPTLNFRGLDNTIYYLLDSDPRHYRNFTGCGNTVNCGHPVVRDYILDCLRYWVLEMHIDGFRFDLASVMARDEDGELQADAPLLERIAEDPILRDVKLIAEAWDAAGVYQVGRFPGQRWSEWNASFRDDVRRFWRGDPGMRGALASRLCGSADLYQHSGKAPLNSINFVTCHDGFTLNDLVSYAVKHNQANGEQSRDGMTENFSANYGMEGPTDDVKINTLRLRQMKNFIATLMLSRGVPMLLGGDEFGRSQGGNNNAYCQDNETSWYDWTLLQTHGELHRFTRDMIALRKRHSILRIERFYTTDELSWFDSAGHYPDWHALDRSLGCHIHPQLSVEEQLCLLFNAEAHTVSFQLPDNARWRVMADTAVAFTSENAIDSKEAAVVPGEWFVVQPCSFVVLHCGVLSRV